MKKILLLLVSCFLFSSIICSAQVRSKSVETDSITTVYFPLLANNNTRIFNWAINQVQKSVDGTTFAFYKLYLNSLNCKYSFFVPTDNFFSTYIDPIAYGQDAPQGGLQFRYNATTNKVYAIVRTFNKNVNPPVFSDSIGVITTEGLTTGQASVVEAFLQDRLWKILDSHLVEGDVESGNSYFVTKGNDLIKVNGTGTSMTVAGGYDLNENTPSKVTAVFRQTNGSTYFIDKPIQPALKSVYKVLSETQAFSSFYNLLNGVPDTCVYKIFSPQGVDFKINSFYTYQYTIYVPTNEALQAAIDQGLIKSWETIYALPSGPQQASEINKIVRFLRYHFQDEAVFFGQQTDGIFNSATIKNDNASTHFQSGKNHFYKIGVNGNETSMTITTENNQTAHVVVANGLYNIIAKDFIFSKVPSYYKNMDGSGPSTGAAFITSSITTSSSVVIHQIDKALTFQ